MCCRGSQIGQSAEDVSKPITVEQVIFYRSDVDGNPTEDVKGTFYTTDHRLHVQIILSHVLVGSYGRIVWICRDSRGVAEPDTEVVTCDLTSLMMNVIDTHAELHRDWPMGEYELQFYVNNTLLHQAPFRVIEPP